MKRESSTDKMFILFNYAFILVMTAIILYPLLFIVSASVSDPLYVNSGQMLLWPKGLTFEGYDRVFQNPEIWLGYRNTVFYTVVGVMINLFFTLPGAYALSRKDLVGRNFFTFLIVFTMFFGGGIIPTYLLIKDLYMVNTVWALMIPNAAGVMQVIVTRTFFQSNVPRELEEAAEMDGCSPFRLFFSIVMPISKPIIAVMALFYGVGHWNQYFNALIYISDRHLYPLQLFLREILVLNQMNDVMMTDAMSIEAILKQARVVDLIKYAVMIVAALPLLIAYPFLQRYFMKGVLIGSLKG